LLKINSISNGESYDAADDLSWDQRTGSPALARPRAALLVVVEVE
jgi:hypothetical protein